MGCKKLKGSELTRWDLDTPEVFHFGIKAYDVQEAKALIAARPRDLVELELEPEIAALCVLPGQVRLGIVTTHEGVEKADLTIPLIVTPSGVPIDGWHRVAKALTEGRKTLPCVVLTKAEMKKVELV